MALTNEKMLEIFKDNIEVFQEKISRNVNFGTVLITIQQAKDGSFGLGYCPAPNDMLQNSRTKDMLAFVFKSVVESSGAKGVMLFQQANVIMYDRDDLEAHKQMKSVRQEKLRVEQIPGNKEVLVCHFETTTIQRMIIIEVIGKPPFTFKEISSGKEGDEMIVTGRFSNLLYKKPINKFSGN